MSKELIVSASSQETKAAILEGGEVVEIHIEREGDQGIVGSICKGRVTKVLPGMQSAFVNVGLERDAFLYVSDFFEDTDEYDLITGGTEEQVAKLDQAPGPDTARQSTPGGEDSGGARQSDRRMRPRRARRGRLRGKRQEAAPSEPSATEAGSPPTPPPPPPLPVPVSDPPESLSVLPGESLAKYSAVSEPPPAAETESAPQDVVQSEPAATAETAATTEPIAPSEPAAAEETTVQPEPTAAAEPTPATEPDSPRLKGRRGRRRSRQAAAESAEADASAASPEAAQDPDTEVEVNADGEAGTAEVEEPTAQVEELTAEVEEATAESATVEVEEKTAESEPSTGDSEPATEASSAAAADSVTVSEEPEAATEDAPSSLAQAESAAEEPGEEAEAARETDAQAPPESDAAEETESAGEPAPEVAEPAAEAAADESGAAAAATYDDGGEQVEAAEASTAVDSPEEPGEVSAETDQAQEPVLAEVAESPDSAADGASAGAAEPETETVGATDAPSAPTSRPRASNAQHRSRPSTPRFFRRSPDRRRSQYRGEDRQRREAASPAPMIADLLKEGQEILVQIAKEPLGTKGARITSHIAIPGRYLVYMPTVNHIGVSRKISSGDERQRLRRIIQDNRGDLPGGFIVRTAGEYKGEDEFKADIGFLRALWTEVKTQSDKKSAPAIIHRELNLVQRILRDQFNREFSAIRVDNELAYASIVDLIHRFQPRLVKKVKLYTRETPIFEEFGVQAELDKALRSKVWLKSGGYIVIDQAEALVAIDVNTGKYVGKSNKLEDTIAKTNMEAAKEIARQLRLRDLGGIIVCDFIDMEDRKNRLKVTQTLEAALRRDKSPSKVLQFNDFGLVAITRKRVKQSLLKVLCEPCSQCSGSGMVKSPQTVCYEIQGEARKMASAIEDPEITVRVHPRVAKALKTTEATVVDELESSLKKDVVIKSDPLFPQERFDIF